MNTHKVQVLEIDDIMDALFFQDDVGSRDQVLDELAMTDWTYGGTPYTLVTVQDFHAWIQDVVDEHLVAGLYARSQLDILAPFLGEDQNVYVNLEAM